MWKKWLVRIWQSKFIRGSAVFTVISFLVSILNYGFNFLVARYFPLASYGEYMTAVAYMGMLTFPLGMLNVLLVKKIGSFEHSKRKTAAWGLEKSFILLIKEYRYLILVFLTVLTIILLFRSNLSHWSVFWIIAMASISLITTFYTASLQSFKYFWQAGSINVFAASIKIALVVLVIYFFRNVYSLYLIILLSVVTAAIWSRRAAFGSAVATTAVSFNKNIKLKNLLIKDYWLPLLASLGMIGMLSIDLIVVKNVYTPDSAGLYAGLSLLGKIILFVTAPLSTVAFTFFTGIESKHSSQKILVLNSVFILISGLVLMTSYVLFSDLIINIILGPKFVSLAPFIYLAAIFGLLYSLNNLYSQYALARNSLISLAPLAAVILQTLLLVYFHRDVTQIMHINIFVSSLVLISFTIWFIKDKLLQKT